MVEPTVDLIKHAREKSRRVAPLTCTRLAKSTAPASPPYPGVYRTQSSSQVCLPRGPDFSQLMGEAERVHKEDALVELETRYTIVVDRL